MKNLKKIVAKTILIAFILIGYCSFAGTPPCPPNTPGCDGEGNVIDNAPIDQTTFIIFALVAGSCLGFYALRKKRLQHVK